MRHRLCAVLLRRIIFPVLPEHIAAPVGPVELIEINVIRLEPAQGAFNGFANGSRGNPGPFAHIRHARTRVFGGQDHILAPPCVFKPQPNDPLCPANCLGAHGVHGIHLSGIDKIDPGIQRPVNLRVGFLSCVLRAPGHGPKTKLRHIQDATKFVSLHDWPLSFAHTLGLGQGTASQK